jgi:hypothetical protein
MLARPALSAHLAKVSIEEVYIFKKYKKYIFSRNIYFQEIYIFKKYIFSRNIKKYIFSRNIYFQEIYIFKKHHDIKFQVKIF